MNPMRSHVSRASMALAVLMLAQGCYSTTNRVTLSPLDTQHPVSASASYVDATGKIVTESEYERVGSFEFDRSINGPRHENTETSLQLDEPIDQLLTQNHADAATRVKIEGTDYDRGSHQSAANWKWAGWLFEINAGVLLGFGATAKTSDERQIFLGSGGIVAGVGVLTYLAAFLADDPASWKLRVSGDLVRKREAESARALTR